VLAQRCSCPYPKQKHLTMSDKLRVIIADDEKSSREIIADYLSRYYSGIEILSQAEDAKQAIEQIIEHNPDLVFLDVEMPYGNAFDVLEQTKDIDFHTIFITAFSDYAIKALNYSAAYYILKPISIDELVNAVDKVKELKHESDYSELKKVLLENLGSEGVKRIVLPNQNGFEIVNANEIVRITGNGNYSDLYLSSGVKKTVSKVLKYFSHLEESDNFIRVHKSHIVNIEFIKAYHKGRGGSLIMTDGGEVEVSASKKGDLLNALKV
jgi:two-component system LytT family response regulator